MKGLDQRSVCTTLIPTEHEVQVVTTAFGLINCYKYKALEDRSRLTSQRQNTAALSRLSEVSRIICKSSGGFLYRKQKLSRLENTCYRHSCGSLYDWFALCSNASYRYYSSNENEAPVIPRT